MSEEICQPEIQRALPLSYSKGQRDAPLLRGKNTHILDVTEFHKDRGRIRLEIDEFDGTVPHGRKHSIAGWRQSTSGTAQAHKGTNSAPSGTQSKL